MRFTTAAGDNRCGAVDGLSVVLSGLARGMGAQAARSRTRIIGWKYRFSGITA
jgi:hypothetical protein